MRNLKNGFGPLRTTSYELVSPKIGSDLSGYKLVQVSDLHSAVFGDRQRELLQRIEQCHPDLIVITGDLADDGKKSFASALDLAAGLASIAPVRYTLGNHEMSFKKKDRNLFLAKIREKGVVLFNDKQEIFFKGKDAFVLYGFRQPMKFYNDPFGAYGRGHVLTKKDIEAQLGTVNSECFSILLAHDPRFFPAFHAWGADLTLSGHIHGGVIGLPGNHGLFSPDVTFFPPYCAGRYTLGDHTLIISRGLGNNFLMRINNPPELVVITLKGTTCKHQNTRKKENDENTVS